MGVEMTSPIASSSTRLTDCELSNWLDEVRDRGFWLGLVSLYLGGLLVVGSPWLFSRPNYYLVVALLCFVALAMSGLAWIKSRLAASWLLIIGQVAILLLAAGEGQFDKALYLLALPVGLAFLILGHIVGLVLGLVATSFFLLVPTTWFPLSASERLVSTAGIWILLSIAWLLQRVLLRAVEWAWTHYEQSQAVLNEVHDQRLKLAQTIEDLRAANLQMTRLNCLAQTLRQLAEEERRAKEQFVANVSHELRTPLNMIIGFCELMANSPQTYGGKIPKALLADLDVVLRNSRHLAALIDDVLDLSQIEAGQMGLIKEQVDLGELIESASIAIRPLYDSKGLSLDITIAPDLPTVFCDRTRIREVLLNLLSNAGRFTERGGVQVKAWMTGGDVIISVIDTGPGIASEHLQRLFRPFEQLDGSIRRRHGGTGLGLSISKGIVELHGGKLWVESKVGHGTAFYFRLPIVPPAPMENKVTRWFNPYTPFEERPWPVRLDLMPVRPRYVVVESGTAMQRLLSRHLYDAEVVTAPTLEAAIAELAVTPAQALLINEMDIGQTFNRVASYESLSAGIPAIICSVPGATNAAVSLGVSDYLVKPISRETLLTALDRLGSHVKHVLLIDDEADALHLFSRMLTESGRDYIVHRAESARQALQMAIYERPDVILLDLVMGEMDGFGFLAACRESAVLRDIPIILISARDPQGQPIVSKGLAVTCQHGLSVQEVLACIEALTAILAKSASQVAPKLTTTPLG
ncbi:MAG: ATP-binding protein [Gemmatales bacterium]|nr:ATP-binding protein [Gemmatales bacterium]